jgi:hypothetical protein
MSAVLDTDASVRPRVLSMRAVAWGLLTVGGLAVGGFAFHFPGSASASWDMSALVFGTLLGGLNGLAVGLLQATSLRGAVSRPGRHVWTMGVIVGATHGAYDGSRDPGLLLQLGSGIVAAGAVRLLIGERRPRVLCGVAIGWAVGLVVASWVTPALGMPWSETPIGWSMEHLVAGVVTGTIYSVAVIVGGLPGLDLQPSSGQASEESLMTARATGG